MEKAGQYYALCTQDEEGANEVALLHLRDDEELGEIPGISIYTSLDGAVQREDLQKWERVKISPISTEEFLDAVQSGMPSSVFVDGQKVAGSVFNGMLKSALGLPTKRPRTIRPNSPSGSRP